MNRVAVFVCLCVCFFARVVRRHETWNELLEVGGGGGGRGLFSRVCYDTYVAFVSPARETSWIILSRGLLLGHPLHLDG